MRGAGSTASGDPKNAHLRRLEGAPESLLLFKADVLDRDALAAAVAGCEGVFHAASPVPSVKVADPEASTYLTRSSSFDFVPGVFFRTKDVLKCWCQRAVTVHEPHFVALFLFCD